ncbi:hypothetical protein [Clostridium minihomine]|uniref:hypothetical protein n=1 Tax=Clostridium minihomine TaxID=2045012 RepID=UPI000C7862DC|nr:hypothetical protein [Clostridium minihomine]
MLFNQLMKEICDMYDIELVKGNGYPMLNGKELTMDRISDILSDPNSDHLEKPENQICQDSFKVKFSEKILIYGGNSNRFFAA